MTRVWMDRFIDTIEWIAAGIVGIVAADIFLSVLLRNTLNYSIPEWRSLNRWCSSPSSRHTRSETTAKPSTIYFCSLPANLSPARS